MPGRLGGAEAARGTSGLNPILIVLAGDGSEAALIRAAVPPRWILAAPEDEAVCARAAILIEAAGGARHEQLAVLRQLSALAADDAVIISTSPVLSLAEAAASVTNPARLVRLVLLGAGRTGCCEIIRSADTGEDAVVCARDLARQGGWRILMERDGGPSALLRLIGAIMLGAWRAVLRTGRAAEIDRRALAEGLPWRPLRELDAFGLRRAAETLDRAGELAGVEAIFASAWSEDVSARLAAKCGTDLIDDVVPSGYFIACAVEALAPPAPDGPDDRRDLRRALAAGCGYGFAAAVWRAAAARYPEMAGRSRRRASDGPF